MRQYCKYCTSQCTANGIWCDEKKKELTYAATVRENQCNEYNACNVDAYTGIEKKETVKRVKAMDQCEGQISLF